MPWFRMSEYDNGPPRLSTGQSIVCLKEGSDPPLIRKRKSG
ncbi:hypothetical protein PORCRE_1474 [Porphyromonas crevioricanis JCM 15906]|uniref:Uncharacterized protein n=1 Tax=Porphyromonas crevioricanis JCM 15906 TaxID=1305617 RepID=T1CI65_9PORP|nr:hypothetical protein PORCRE_1474 [Porphyromonas crevioricanis JCM 15906]GAD06963.1 hypothetical protein PORCAN_574 [Porphyromonas crevioricanis JCM 13913]